MIWLKAVFSLNGKKWTDTRPLEVKRIEALKIGGAPPIQAKKGYTSYWGVTPASNFSKSATKL